MEKLNVWSDSFVAPGESLVRKFVIVWAGASSFNCSLVLLRVKEGASFTAEMVTAMSFVTVSVPSPVFKLTVALPTALVTVFKVSVRVMFVPDAGVIEAVILFVSDDVTEEVREVLSGSERVTERFTVPASSRRFVLETRVAVGASFTAATFSANVFVFLSTPELLVPPVSLITMDNVFVPNLFVARTKARTPFVSMVGNVENTLVNAAGTTTLKSKSWLTSFVGPAEMLVTKFVMD